MEKEKKKEWEIRKGCWMPHTIGSHDSLVGFLSLILIHSVTEGNSPGNFELDTTGRDLRSVSTRKRVELASFSFSCQNHEAAEAPSWSPRILSSGPSTHLLSNRTLSYK